MKYVLYGRVIDSVKDEAVENGMVIVDGERILYAGERNDEMVTDDMQVRDAGNGTIMPGFIDAHAHLTGEESRNSSGTSAFDALLTVVKDLGELVDAGVTGVRDMSLFGKPLKNAVEKGNILGPRITPGGRVLSVSAGHCDFDTDLSVKEANEKSLTGYLMDGPEDCLRGVRQQFRDGAEFIKICATGGVSSAVDNINDVQFSDEELRVIVGEAARHGTYVTAHCTGTAGTLQALKCGVTCIEHGVMLDEECIAIMKEKDIPLVTTLSVALGLADMKNLPDFMMKKAVSVKESAMNSFRMAHEAGIRVALGTDYSNTGNTPFKHIGKEFYSLTRCGYTPMEAIKAGTVNGAYLMRKDQEIGTLEAGKLADLVIVNGNPLEDILVLADADNISTVMIGGKIVKG
ncbi:amidohydrolase family protein [Lachnotalea sp. AF33-28]|uniref:amidohydrolase family protein n=1 Tax=Lachnotalea sp. AF33-28 TaxID=2292046 RepID=UPI000E54A727|nr:amidohydrolase family protein [Lachnotalea sp. AF33-28]RHP30080.1 amidohydrolase family protein [Lachnotalea sp. AF33-28]